MITNGNYLLLEPVRERFLNLRYQPNEYFVQTLFGMKKWAVWEHDNACEMLFGSKKRQPTPNSTWTLNFVQIIFGCDVTCDLCDSCDAPTYMHMSNEPHINHVQTYSPRVHTTIINYDRPLEKRMFIWFMRCLATQKFFRAQKHNLYLAPPK